MTSKATLLHDAQLRIAGFVEHELIVPLRDEDKRRRLWVSNDVSNLLCGKKNPEAGFPHVSCDVDIGRICKGHIVSVTRKQQGKSDFKWLTGHDEVWVLSFRKPRPGWRIFGRFARKNVFVACRYYQREDLGGMVQYNEAAKDLISHWDQTFPGVQPYRSGKILDYLGPLCRDDDE